MTDAANLLSGLFQTRSQRAEGLLRYLKQQITDLTANPLLQRLNLTLDDMRIDLRVVPFAPPRDDSEAMDSEHLRAALPYAGPNNHNQLYAPDQHDQTRQPATAPEPRPLNDLNLQRAVILGDPGSGKTEWLKYQARAAAIFAYQALDSAREAPDALTIPIFARLPDIAKTLQGKDIQGYHELSQALQTHCGLVDTLTAPASRFAAALLVHQVTQNHLPRRAAPDVWDRLKPDSPRNNQMRLYLDGLDEVSQQKPYLLETLNAYAQDAQNTVILLTSRTYGYKSLLLAVAAHSDLQPESWFQETNLELRILPFTRDDTTAFVRKFYPPPSDSANQAQKDRARIGAQLLADLDSKPSILGMAQNPLLVMLLCKLFAPTPDGPKVLSLPATRCQVYEQVLCGLLSEWKQTKEPAESNDEFEALEQINLLQDIAYHLFPHNSFTAKELTGLCESQQFKQFQADAVFISEGNGVYRFLHLTFQEYLTARAIARHTKKRSRRLEKALTNLYAPSWQEVLRLLGGAWKDDALSVGTSAKQCRNYLETLVQAAASDIYRRPLLLAAAATGEASRFVTDRSVREWSAGFAAAFLSFYLDPPHYLRREELRAALLQIGPASLTQAIAERLQSEESSPQREELFELLGALGATSVNVLWACLANNEFKPQRKAIIDSLRHIGPSSATALKDLRRLMRDPFETAAMRIEAAAAIGAIGPAAVDLAPELRDMCLGHSDRNARRKLIRALGRLGLDALPHLLEILATEPENSFDTRAELISAIAQHGPAASQALPILQDILRGNKRLHRAATQALCRIDPALASSWLSNLRQERDPTLRQWQAYQLGYVMEIASFGTQELLAVFRSEQDYFARVKLAVALRKQGRSAAPALPTLMRIIQEDCPPDQLPVYIETLGRIRAAGAIPLLRDIYFAETNTETCVTIIEALGSIGGPHAGEALVQMLAAAPEVRLMADLGRNLASLGPLNETAASLLTNALQTTQGIERLHIVTALVRQGPRSAATAEAIMRALQAEPNDSIKAQMAGVLGHLGVVALEELRLALNSEKNSVVLVAVIRATGFVGAPARSLKERLWELARVEEQSYLLQALAEALCRITSPDEVLAALPEMNLPPDKLLAFARGLSRPSHAVTPDAFGPLAETALSRPFVLPRITSAER